jgi:hypothetical protein
MIINNALFDYGACKVGIIMVYGLFWTYLIVVSLLYVMSFFFLFHFRTYPT